jgi:hypothetical protein
VKILACKTEMGGLGYTIIAGLAWRRRAAPAGAAHCAPAWRAQAGGKACGVNQGLAIFSRRCRATMSSTRGRRSASYMPPMTQAVVLVSQVPPAAKPTTRASDPTAIWARQKRTGRSID